MEIKQRILVVDDTEMVRTTTAMMLESLVCDVEVAKSGHEAMSKVAFNDYDLILMDCQMPLMDGLETCRRLMGLYPERNLKIVAITAHTTPRDKVRSTEAGAVTWIGCHSRMRFNGTKHEEVTVARGSSSTYESLRIDPVALALDAIYTF